MLVARLIHFLLIGSGILLLLTTTPLSLFERKFGLGRVEVRIDVDIASDVGVISTPEFPGLAEQLLRGDFRIVV